MRPVEKGNCPQEGGADVVFKNYQDARGPLIKQIGEYCSFCEMHLDASLAVEHKLPKNVVRFRHLEREWTNFLLACANCNSNKGGDDIEEDDFLWPDKHNTFHALKYGPGALVRPNVDLSESEKQKAQALIDLVGLDKLPGNLKTVSDRRWLNRQESWDMAERQLDHLHRNDTLELRQCIALNARSNGYFCVWMTVFTHDSDMLQRIIEEFPGTSKACFVEGKCITRVTR